MIRTLLAAGLGLVLVATASGDDGKKALEKIQGTWVASVYEVDGQKASPVAVSTIKFVCTDDKYTQSIRGMIVEKGTHKLDPTKKPMHMDISITEGEEKGQLQLAIYEVDGDTLKICANTPGNKERPKEFSSKPGSGHLNIVLKREKKDQ